MVVEPEARRRGHSHALAWQAAGWKTQEVDLEEEVLRFTRREVASQTDGDVDRPTEVFYR